MGILRFLKAAHAQLPLSTKVACVYVPLPMVSLGYRSSFFYHVVGKCEVTGVRKVSGRASSSTTGKSPTGICDVGRWLGDGFIYTTCESICADRSGASHDPWTLSLAFPIRFLLPCTRSPVGFPLFLFWFRTDHRVR